MPGRVGLLVHSSILSGLSDGRRVVFVDKLHESSAYATSGRTLTPSGFPLVRASRLLDRPSAATSGPRAASFPTSGEREGCLQADIVRLTGCQREPHRKYVGIDDRMILAGQPPRDRPMD